MGSARHAIVESEAIAILRMNGRVTGAVLESSVPPSADMSTRK